MALSIEYSLNTNSVFLHTGMEMVCCAVCCYKRVTALKRRVEVMFPTKYNKTAIFTAKLFFWEERSTKAAIQ